MRGKVSPPGEQLLKKIVHKKMVFGVRKLGIDINRPVPKLYGHFVADYMSY